MATEILDGVLYYGVEIYVDDMYVFGHTEEEFLTNLRKVFERFRLKGAKLHPLKSDLGFSEMEMCGHSIDKSGIHFIKSKLDSVKEFPNQLQIKCNL